MPALARVPAPRCAPPAAFRRGFSTLSLSLAVLALAACDKMVDPGADWANPERANANGRIRGERLLGSAGNVSAVHTLSGETAAPWWFTGELDGRSAFGRIDATGQMPWSQPAAATLRRVVPFPQGSPVPGGAVAILLRDTDGDSRTECTDLELRRPGGELAGTLAVASDSADIALYALVPIADTLLLAAGSERRPSGLAPLFMTIAVGPDGALAPRARLRLGAMSGLYVFDLAVDPAEQGLASRRVYAVTWASPGWTQFSVRAFTLTLPDLSACTLEWSQTLTGKGHETYEYDLACSGGDVYVAGLARDPDKGRPEGSTVFWGAGLAARIARGGEVVWSRVGSIMAEEDHFERVLVRPEAVIFLGTSGRCSVTLRGPGTVYEYGFGWVHHVEPASGRVLADWTFGEATYASGFGDGVVDGSTLHAVGWSRMTATGGRRGWWCDVDLTPNTAPRAATPVPGRTSAAMRSRVPAPPGRAPGAP